MLRLLKVLKIFDVLRDLFRLRPSLLRLFKAAFSICLIAHIGACGWWYIKVQNTGGIEEFKADYNIEDSAYLTSIYFMLATLCTVGYGDISATTDPERIFSIIVMLIGASAFAIIVSNMSALAASMQSEENKHMEKMDSVIDFLRQNNLSRELERRVESFFQFRATQKFNFEMRADVLDGLPSGLVRRIKVELNSQLVKSTFLFDKMDSDHVEDIIDKLDVKLKSPGEKILKHGSFVEGLYIVVSGEVELSLPRPSQPKMFETVEKIKAGGVFGEEGLIFHVSCPFEASAVGFVELCFLSAEGLEEVAPKGRSSEARKKLRGLAVERRTLYQGLFEWKISEWVPRKQNALGRWSMLLTLVLRNNRQSAAHNSAHLQRLAKFSAAKLDGMDSDEEIANLQSVASIQSSPFVRHDSHGSDIYPVDSKDAAQDDLASVSIYPAGGRKARAGTETNDSACSQLSQTSVVVHSVSSVRQLTPPPSIGMPQKEKDETTARNKFKDMPDQDLEIGSVGRFPSIKKLSEFAEDIEAALLELSFRLKRKPQSKPNGLQNGAQNGSHNNSAVDEELGFEDTNILTDAQIFGEGVGKLASRFRKLRRDWESKPEVPQRNSKLSSPSPKPSPSPSKSSKAAAGLRSSKVEIQPDKSRPMFSSGVRLAPSSSSQNDSQEQSLIEQRPSPVRNDFKVSRSPLAERQATDPRRKPSKRDILIPDRPADLDIAMEFKDEGLGGQDSGLLHSPLASPPCSPAAGIRPEATGGDGEGADSLL